MNWFVGAPCDWLTRGWEERGGAGLTSLTRVTPQRARPPRLTGAGRQGRGWDL